MQRPVVVLMVVFACPPPEIAAQRRSTPAAVEDIHIARSVRTARAMATEFCAENRSGFGGAVFEDRFTFHATGTRASDGKMTNSLGNKIGELRACFGPTSNPMKINFYAEGELSALSFTGKGECEMSKSDFPEAGMRVGRCFLDLTDLPRGSAQPLSLRATHSRRLRRWVYGSNDRRTRFLSNFAHSFVLPALGRTMEQLEFHDLLNQLRRHEGFRLRHYQDRTGKFSPGVGRNLEEVAAIRAGAVTLLERDVRRIVQQLEEGLRTFGTLNVVRQRVLIHMAFNISVSGLLLMNRFVAAVELGYWTVAAEEMLHSAWAAEGRERAAELAEMMRTGHDRLSLVSERRGAAG